jgi:hypothetical protein
MNPGERGLDDLTVITGIGAARQKWLREAFGVQTFSDLAALSADEIEARLRQEEQIISRKTIEVWIAEAQEHASPNNTTSRKKTRNAPHKEDWSELATFVIEFQERTVSGQAVEYQTTVFHSETEVLTKWPGLDPEQYIPWMLAQVSDKVSLEPAEPAPASPEEAPAKPVSPAPAELPSMDAKITQIRAFQPPEAAEPVGSGQADQPFDGIIQGHEQFALEIAFRLVTETAADFSNRQAVYTARAYVKDAADEDIHLGDTEPAPFITGQLTYTARLSDLTLAPGTYRLFALITIQGAPIKPHFIRLPVFTVT